MSILDKLTEIGEDLNKYKDTFLEVFTNPRLRIISIILFILFFSVSVYIYFKFIDPRLKKDYVDNREFVNKEDDKMVVLWFYTEWCPFCKSTYGEWSTFKSKVEEGDYGIPIEFREVDCDNDNVLADRYDIKEYPSIRIVYKDEVYIYDAKPDYNDLLEFLNGSIPESKRTQDNQE